MKCKMFIFCAVVMVTLLFAATSAVTPVYCPGNPKCSDINCTSQSCTGSGCPGESFKLDSGPWGGNHVIPETSCYISIEMVNDTHFTFTSNAEINAVIVKGGPNSNVYFYDPPVYSDTDYLSPPLNPSSGKYYDISHIEFCYTCNNIPVPEFPPFIFGFVLIGSIFAVIILTEKRFTK